MRCGYNDIIYAPPTTLDEGLVAASTLWIMSRKELPIRFKAYPHANDNGSVSGSPPDPRLLSLARLIARSAVRDLIDGQTANDNADKLTPVAGQHPVEGTEPTSTATLVAAPEESTLTAPLPAEPLSPPQPLQNELPLEADAISTRAPSLPDLPTGTQLYLFPDLDTARDHDDQ